MLIMVSLICTSFAKGALKHGKETQTIKIDKYSKIFLTQEMKYSRRLYNLQERSLSDTTNKNSF